MKNLLELSLENIYNILPELKNEFETVKLMNASEVLVDYILKNINLVVDLYVAVYGENEETLKLRDFNNTVIGLVQLKVIANFGEFFYYKIRDAMVAESGKSELTLFELARSIKTKLSYNGSVTDSDALDLQHILSAGPMLINNMIYNVYYHTELTYPELNDIDKIKSISFNLWYVSLNSALLKQIAMGILDKKTPPNIDTLNMLKVFIDKVVIPTGENLNFLLFINTVNHVLDSNKSTITKAKQDKLGLRVIK